MTVYVPFAARSILDLGTLTPNGTRLKHYAVVHAGETFEPARFVAALALVEGALPPPSPEHGRPGAGFLIFHQGLTGDYTVLGWWDQQNELPLRVWVRDRDDWRPARDSESVCVWDLELIWFERNAWIDTALAGQPIDEAVVAYGTRRFTPAEAP